MAKQYDVVTTRVRVRVMRGRELAAKDGIRSSDPYVEVFAYNELIGKTHVLENTVYPVWHAAPFTTELEGDFPHVVTFKIWDEDFSGAPASMGEINIKINPQKFKTLNWYEIPPKSSKSGASGALLVKLETLLFLPTSWSDEAKIKRICKYHDEDQKEKNKLTKVNASLKIISGKGLEAKDRDIIGRKKGSDPYVEIYSEGELVGSTTFQEQTLNPIWNEPFALELPGEKVHQVLLEVWDYNSNSKPDFMGSVILEIQPEPTTSPKFLTVPIDPNSAAGAKGRLQLELETTIAKPNELKTITKTKESLKTRLRVKILKARYLCAKDGAMRSRNSLIGTSSDPYVEVYAYNELFGTTPVIHKSIYPQWFDAEQFTIDLQGDYSHTLSLKIWDEDVGEAPDSMGEVKIEIKPKECKTLKWYEIPKKSARGARGSLLVELNTQLIYPDSWSEGKKLKRMIKYSEEDAPKSITKVNAKLTILNGKGLAAKDRDMIGRKKGSDPYVEIYSENEILGLTKYHKNSLNPIWNESFSLELLGKKVHKLLLKVWDYNPNSKPDLMGSITLYVQPEPTTTPKTLCLAVDSNTAAVAEGELEVQLETTIAKPNKRKTITKAEESLKTRLHVKILKARYLCAKDGAMRSRNSLIGTSSDPYVEVYAYNELFGTTPVIHKSIYPQWFDAEQFTIDLQGDYSHTLSLKIWDEDVGEAPDSMGEVKIEIKPKECKTLKWYEIPKKSARGARGSLLVELNTQLIYPDSWSEGKKLKRMIKYSEEDASEKVNIKLKILKAKYLAAKDRKFVVGRRLTSDPYVEIYSENEILGLTKFHESTLNPIWNESFALQLPGDRVHKLLLKVWDYDPNSEPDSLGSGTIEIHPKATTNPIMSCCFIDPDSAPGATGELHFEYEMNVTKSQTKDSIIQSLAMLKSNNSDRSIKSSKSERSLRSTTSKRKGPEKSKLSKNNIDHSLRSTKSERSSKSTKSKSKRSEESNLSKSEHPKKKSSGSAVSGNKSLRKTKSLQEGTSPKQKPPKSASSYAPDWRERIAAGNAFDSNGDIFDFANDSFGASDLNESAEDNFLHDFGENPLFVDGSTKGQRLDDSSKDHSRKSSTVKSFNNSMASLMGEMEQQEKDDHAPSTARFADTGKDTVDTYFLAPEVVEVVTTKAQITILRGKGMHATSISGKRLEAIKLYVETWVYGHHMGTTATIPTMREEWQNETYNTRLTGNYVHTVYLKIFGIPQLDTFIKRRNDRNFREKLNSTPQLIGIAPVEIRPESQECKKWCTVGDDNEAMLYVKVSTLCLHPKKGGKPNAAIDHSKDHEYEGTGKNSSDQVYFLLPEPVEFASTKIQLEILKAKDLPARDRDRIGRKTSSDPFVEVWAHNHRYGATSTVGKSLNPEWNGELFNLRLRGDYSHEIVLKIWDEDLGSKPDLLGAITIKVFPENVDITQWYDIPLDSAKGATGRLKLRLKSLCLRPGDVLRKKTPKKLNKENSDALALEEYTSAFSDNESDQKQPKPKKKEEPMPKLTVHCIDTYTGITMDNELTKQRVSRLEGEIEYLKEDLFKSRVFVGNIIGSKTDQDMLQLLRDENKRLDELKAEMSKSSRQNAAFQASTKTDVKLTIIQGSRLVAKDDIEGREASSDPYVEIWKEGVLVGKTSTRMHTISPKWNECFQFQLSRDIAWLDLKIFDEDFEGPDSMGTIRVKIQDKEEDRTEWISIDKYSNITRDAKGMIEVKVETKPIANPQAHIDELEKEVLRLQEEVEEVARVSLMSVTNNKAIMKFLKNTNAKLSEEIEANEGGGRLSGSSMAMRSQRDIRSSSGDKQSETLAEVVLEKPKKGLWSFFELFDHVIDNYYDECIDQDIDMAMWQHNAY